MILAIIFISVIGYTTIGIVIYKIEFFVCKNNKHMTNDNANEDSVLIGAFWPITMPIMLIYHGVRLYNKIITYCISKAYMVFRRTKKEHPKFSIPDNFEMDMETYRKLSIIISDFEKKIPIMERE